jgi:hypothetical protein
VVLKRGGVRAAVLVRWDSGREERVKAGEPSVRYAFDGSRRLQWLLEPDVLTKQFASDAKSAFVDVIRDEGRTIQAASVKRRLIELGLTAARVDEAYGRVRPSLVDDPHIVVNRGYTWSDTPVDPWEAIRRLDPHAALDQLLQTTRFKPGQKTALADAIRAGLSPRKR